MGLLDSLKRVEEQGRQAARRGTERAGEKFDDVERRIRRKMRIHPSPAKTRVTSSAPEATGDIDKQAA